MRRYYEVDDADVDERGVVRDGGRVHVPIYLTDSRRAPILHKPGIAARLTDDETDLREQAYAARNARTTSAWRTPAPSDDDYDLAARIAPLLGLPGPKRVVRSNDGGDPRAAAEAALADRSAWKASAWKSGARR